MKHIERLIMKEIRKPLEAQKDGSGQGNRRGKRG